MRNPQPSLKERFSFHSRALPDDQACKVIRFAGTEGLNMLYSFDIQLMCQIHEGKALDTTTLLVTPATLRIDRGDSKAIVFHGYPIAISQKGHMNGWTFYTLTLQPQFAKLQHIVQNHIYLEKNTKDIVAEAFDSCGIMKPSHTFLLHKTCPTHEFSMQYNENVLDFMAFHLERDGIYYFFEQNEDAENIVFTDSPISHTYLEGNSKLRYYPTSGLEGDHADEIIISFVMNQVPLPKNVIVRDYDWQKPNFSVEATATVDEYGLGTLFFYGDGFTTEEEGQRLANIRAQALRCRSKVFTGTSSVPSLRPGYLFSLHDHYDAAFNASYFITHVTHEGSQEAYLSSVLGVTLEYASDKLYYRNTFTCIPEHVQFRPERKTVRKSIPGMLHAFIDSSSNSPMAEIDSLGRYKVIFPHDPSGRSDGRASCWLRRVQPSVGVGYGTSFPLAPGVEVLVGFVDGNPDKPFISGALNNPETGFSDNEESMFSGMRTGGGGGLTFNDTPQKQGLNLTTGSGRSGLFMASGSMDSTFWQSDYNAQLATVGSASINTVKSTLKSGLSASLEADPSMDAEAMFVLALTSLTKFMEGFQKAGNTDLANVEADIQKAQKAADAAEQAQQRTQDTVKQETQNLDTAQKNESITQEALNTLKRNPHASAAEIKTAQQKYDDAVSQRKQAEKAKHVAQLKNNVAKNTHEAKQKALEKTKNLDAKTTRKTIWDGIVTSLKLLNTCYLTYDKGAKFFKKDKDSSPYTAVLSVADAKSSLKFDIKPTMARLKSIASFATASFVARLYGDTMAQAQESAALQNEEKKLQNERDLAKIDFHNNEAQYLEDEEYQNLREATITAYMNNENISRERARIKVALDEKSLRERAKANVLALSAKHKEERLEVVKNSYYQSIDTTYTHKLHKKKTAFVHALLTSKTPELFAELFAVMTLFKSKASMNKDYGGLKISSDQNSILLSKKHHYIAGEKGISLISLPTSHAFADSASANDVQKIHDDFLGIDKEKSFIAAETEQIKLVGLHNTEIFGLDDCALTSAKNLTVTNKFDNARKDAIQASIKKLDASQLQELQTSLDKASAALSSVQDTVAMGLLFDNMTDAEATLEENTATQALLEAKKALHKALLNLPTTPTPDTYSEISLLRKDNQDVLHLLNKGTHFSLKQVAMKDTSNLEILRTNADESIKTGALAMKKTGLTIIYSQDGEVKNQRSLGFTQKRTSLEHGENSVLFLSDDKLTLRHGKDGKLGHLFMNKEGIDMSSGKPARIASDKTLTLKTKTDAKLLADTSVLVKGGNTSLTLKSGQAKIDGQMIHIG